MEKTALPASLDPQELRGLLPDFAYWFRYPLHRDDFHPLRCNDAGPLLGYFSAKPLYGKLDAHGRVDRSEGFNGRIAGVFVPSPARSWRQAELFFTRIPKQRVTRDDGLRNWPAINAAAGRALRERFG